jgi:hypothetical protein
MGRRLLDALIGYDVAMRAYVNRLGHTAAGRDLARAGAELRRAAGIAALAQEAAAPDPRRDLQVILQAAIAAGLGWTDIAATVNALRDRSPGGVG